MFAEYPKAMHGPDGGYAVVRDQAEETKLRADGWIDGHEFWAKKVHAVENAIIAPLESAIDSVENTLADAADTVAKKLRKPRKPAEQQ